MFTRRTLVAAIAFASVVAIVSVALADLKPGTKAPSFSLPTIDGKTFTLAEKFKQPGNVVLLDIWATWCPPCRSEIPHLVALQKKFQGKKVVFVGVAIDDEKSAVADFAKSNRINYTIAHDPRGSKLRNLYSIQGVPATYIIDKKGVIRYAHSGFPRDAAEAKKEAATFEREINTLLAKK